MNDSAHTGEQKFIFNVDIPQDVDKIMRMKHKAVKDCCETLGMAIRQEPAQGRRSFQATLPGIWVYWSTSATSDDLLGLPRVSLNGRDTHARSVKEIKFLVKNET